ncbi:MULTISPECIES: hypothetical protein [unclassified Microcoleus]|uniref:hypothetical protein n=1 Tax=unclassified Microcoleus TaxID=2642155 RepID=UPI0025CC8969|nr:MULTISPECIES: hypothetical protein [unclassified Microcoleus]
MRTSVRNMLRTEVRTTNGSYRGQPTGHDMILISPSKAGGLSTNSFRIGARSRPTSPKSRILNQIPPEPPDPKNNC